MSGFLGGIAVEKEGFALRVDVVVDLGGFDRSVAYGTSNHVGGGRKANWQAVSVLWD